MDVGRSLAIIDTGMAALLESPLAYARDDRPDFPSQFRKPRLIPFPGDGAAMAAPLTVGPCQGYGPIGPPAFSKSLAEAARDAFQIARGLSNEISGVRESEGDRV